MDGLSLIVSLCVGIVGSLLATFLFPSLQDACATVITRLIGWLPFRKRGSLSGLWTAHWYVNSKRYPPVVTEDLVVVRHLGNRFYARFSTGTLACYLVGRIDAGRYITGTWYDEADGGYHGAFQFVIDPTTRDFEGKWIGFSTSGEVKHGRWKWVRSRPLRTHYPGKAQ
jgi:hypothetical protein